MSFAPHVVSAVHTVPRGGREQEPGYAARAQRVRALKRVHGIQVTAGRVDELYGEQNQPGTRGQYTVHMARRNLWHAGKRGGAWYQPRSTVTFKARYTPEQQVEMLTEMAANLASGRVRI